MIQTLSPHLSALIAAGEVIDAPYSIVRECTDNSIDAGASFISVKYTDKSNIQITDNGCGIEQQDFSVIASMHSTSKIKERNDIYNISTLGFRGEALFSTASVSNLKIESNGYQISIKESKRGETMPSTFGNGMRITVNDLFLNLPARLNFLHSDSYEEKKCRDVFFEKALCYNNIDFSFTDSKGKTTIWKSENRKERINRFLSSNDSVEFNYADKDFIINGFYRQNDFEQNSKKIKVFINGHIVDYKTIQIALARGLDSVLPGGNYPIGVIFINVAPELVDFNVNPTKRECRLRNENQIFRAIVYSVKSSISAGIPSLTMTAAQEVAEIFTTSNPIQRFYPERTKETDDFQLLFNQSEPITFKDTAAECKYIGQAFNLFLIAEKDDNLYFIDQHAAAERVLFDKIKNKSSRQDLLIPINFEVSAEIDAELRKTDAFGKYGIEIKRTNDLEWSLIALPSIWRDKESGIISIICEGNYEDSYLCAKLYSSAACHNSIKQGETLSREVAMELIDEVFKLDEVVCPHGRTFVIKLSKDKLKEGVLR